MAQKIINYVKPISLGLVTGFSIVLLSVFIFCDGNKYSWYCSGHGGCAVFMLVFLPITLSIVFLIIYKVKKRKSL